MKPNSLPSEFLPLWSDLDSAKQFPARRPALAHYTSLQAIDQILRSGEIWFSNPLYMNDWEELRFGVHLASSYFPLSEAVKKALSEDQYQELLRYLQVKFRDFNDKGAFDVYVFCTSEHDHSDDDGLLSMWRGYGAGGKGAAIIFDSNQLEPTEGSPIIVGPVEYMTTEKRQEWMIGCLEKFAEILTQLAPSSPNMQLAGESFFQRICQFALFTKHRGFSEEREWRAVYIAERDQARRYAEYIDVIHDGKGGVAPKFKYRPVQTAPGQQVAQIVEVVNKVILGPGLSDPLSATAAERLLRLSHPNFRAQVVACSTPYRPT